MIYSLTMEILFQVHSMGLSDSNASFRRKLSKREKKQLKKQEKSSRLRNENGDVKDKDGVAEKLYTGKSKFKSLMIVRYSLYWIYISELPETIFTRSISNPEAVMRRRRQQKLEKKLQQFRSKDGGPDTGNKQANNIYRMFQSFILKILVWRYLFF